MSQADLAREMAKRGFPWSSRQTVSEAEAGRRRFGVTELGVLAQVLGVSAIALLAVDDGSMVLEVGEERLDAFAWLRLWGSTRPAESPEAPQSDVSDSREVNLARRAKPIGPTFIADRWLEVALPVPGSLLPAKVVLQPGVPYSARDELESRALRDLETSGAVRRIDRHKAKRMSAATSGTSRGAAKPRKRPKAKEA